MSARKVRKDQYGKPVTAARVRRMLVELARRQPESVAGHCYHDTLLLSTADPGMLAICHGAPTLTGGEHVGRRYGHAWLEFTDHLGIEWCIDHMKLGTPFPRVLFYAVGHIDPDEVHRYSFSEMVERAVRTGHSGPWHEESEKTL